MDKSKIEWTDATWNPVTGCTKVSNGCKHCYAERVWKRLAGNPHCEYFKREFTNVKCHPDRLDQPLRWKKPRRIFVNSMSDLFHESIPFEFIASVFAIMSVTTRHTYQVLTKRPERMIEFFKWANAYPPDEFLADEKIIDHWPEQVSYKGSDNCGPLFPYKNVWLGVSVEDQQAADERIPLLLQTPAAVRWLSLEPLLGPVDFFKSSDNWLKQGYKPWLNAPILTDIHWVVVGGESGPKARPMHPEWVRTIRAQCLAADVPFFFKQWGEYRLVERGVGKGTGICKAELWPGIGDFEKVGKKQAGRVLDGQTWSEYPE